MTELAWRILTLLLAHAQRRAAEGLPLDLTGLPLSRGHLAAWHIGEQLGVGPMEVQWRFPQNEYDSAMYELIVDKGLVEEQPDLGQRYRLCVRL